MFSTASGKTFTYTFELKVKKPQVCALDVREDTRCDDARTLLFGNKTSVGQICSIADTVIEHGKGQELQNIGGGLCLDVDMSSGPSAIRTNGINVQIWSCNGALQQQWTLDANGALRNGGGLCLDVDMSSGPSAISTNGINVQAWSCNGAPQQQWTLDANGALRNGGGLCLDVDMSSGPSAISTNGINVQIWSCNDALQQAWKFNTNGDKLLPDNMPGTCCLDNVKTLQNFGDQVRYILELFLIYWLVSQTTLQHIRDLTYVDISTFRQISHSVHM